MMSVAAGEPVIELLELAYRSDQPVLLIGHRGVGKSQFVEQAARRLGIGYRVRDLSMREPVARAGTPRIEEDGRPRYAAPGFLPRRGRGLLVLEELNRAPCTCVPLASSS